MQGKIESLERTDIPRRWKDVLIEAREYIKENAPLGFKAAYVFGSLSRSELHSRSDIDICLVFENGIDLRERQLVIFKGMLRSISFEVPVDVVCCHEETFLSSQQALYREIRRDCRRFI